MADLFEETFILHFQFFHSVLDAFNVQFQLLLHSDVLSHICLQVLDQLFIDVWTLWVAVFTKARP